MREIDPLLLPALSKVIDPETGRDLVAMGLIYKAELMDGVAQVVMTTTTQGCPLAEMLRLGVEAALSELPFVRSAKVGLTWDPPWSAERIAPLSL